MSNKTTNLSTRMFKFEGRELGPTGTALPTTTAISHSFGRLSHFFYMSFCCAYKTKAVAEFVERVEAGRIAERSRWVGTRVAGATN
jgi:hypothetical protein